jgi:hypothetical protein
MNVKFEPKVRPTLDPGELASSLMTQVKRGMKSKNQEDDFSYRKVEKSKTLIIRSLKVSKCETLKTRNRNIAWSIGYQDFGYREMEKSETLNIRSLEVMKCKTPKTHNKCIAWSIGYRDFRYWEMEKSRVETLQHRSLEVAKCETSKSRNRRIA